MPVRNLRATAAPGPWVNKPKIALVDAPAKAERANNRRVLNMSGRLKKALSKVPATKPSCTAIVSQLAVASERLHSTRNAGTTAEALNQSDIPSNSAADSSASVRQRALVTNESFIS